jgi:hypothetical protein
LLVELFFFLNEKRCAREKKKRDKHMLLFADKSDKRIHLLFFAGGAAAREPRKNQGVGGTQPDKTSALVPVPPFTWRP